jgi:peptidase M42 family hydrolase
MKKLPVDMEYLTKTLAGLLEIPSPSGYTDLIVHFVSEELDRLKLPFEITRRGAIRVTLRGDLKEPARALIAHLDTLGAMVKSIKPNGRLEIVPIGNWSSRFAEGARVSVFTPGGSYRGTILPLKASGHIYNVEIDTQPVAWDNVEIRLDERVTTVADVKKIGVRVGDFVAIDPQPQIDANGFINSRHLDDKAGVACLLAAAQAAVKHETRLPVDCYLLFTLSEEVGSGASAVLHGHVAEIVAVDNSTIGPGQQSCEYGVTICMMDMSGPFDYHLTRKLIDLADKHGIDHAMDVFRFYRCDAASALEAGNDIRTALACFATDASHGYERTHVDSLQALTELLTLYIQSPLTFGRDRKDFGPIAGFPVQPT